MPTSKKQGHEIYYDGEWRFKSDGALCSESDRGCAHCGKSAIIDGDEIYDGCIGKLTGGVTNACCGHGVPSDAFVQFATGEKISGGNAVQYCYHHKTV